ncbi:MAG: stage V sporulation protein AD [bacterium]|nr:stage V sporulation protein AD [bacterium]
MASFKYNNVYIKDWYSIASEKETLSGIKKYNQIINDSYFGEKTYERAEAKMQEVVVDNLIKRNDLCGKIDVMAMGDLSNQLAISNITCSKHNIPYLGCYSACASFNEALIILANMIDAKKIKVGLGLTSSHRNVAERQFRYPIEYGSPRLKRSTLTSTGSVGVILSLEGKIKVESSTIGCVVNYGITDVNNMGAVMAPAAYDTLKKHLKELKRDISYYDLILTGDLGRVGLNLLKDMLKQDGLEINNLLDAGAILYQEEDFKVSGASGPVTLPLVFFNKIISSKKYHKILLLATGALHSTTTTNQKEEIPSISHAVSLEVL